VGKWRCATFVRLESRMPRIVAGALALSAGRAKSHPSPLRGCAQRGPAFRGLTAHGYMPAPLRGGINEVCNR
jgi:hypothetical protein